MYHLKGNRQENRTSTVLENLLNYLFTARALAFKTWHSISP